MHYFERKCRNFGTETGAGVTCHCIYYFKDKQLNKASRIFAMLFILKLLLPINSCCSIMMFFIETENQYNPVVGEVSLLIANSSLNIVLAICKITNAGNRSQDFCLRTWNSVQRSPSSTMLQRCQKLKFITLTGSSYRPVYRTESLQSAGQSILQICGVIPAAVGKLFSGRRCYLPSL